MNRFDTMVEPKDDGRPLLLFLRTRYPLAPEREVRTSLKKRDIRVNGARVRENIPLRAGDSVTWFTGWQQPELEIIFEDEHILVINKPAGISSDRQADGAFSVEEWAQGRGAKIAHRLDQQTSGLLLLSKNPQAEEALGEALRRRKIDKIYHCITAGIPPRRHDVLHAYLYKDASHAKVSISLIPGPFTKQIVTEYDVVEVQGDCALLRVHLHTGRTHQIRAHLAFIGCPLLGDDKYGSREQNRRYKAKRLMLCSTCLGFRTEEGLLNYLNGRSFEISPPF